MPAPPKLRKIAILGSRSVGKSSLTVQFVENHFAETYYPTIENLFTKIIKFRGEEFATEIIDTAGQDEFSILNSKHCIGIHGYIIVYSIASAQSFELCKVIRDKILNFMGIDWIPIVLVANKVDLMAQRQVTMQQGQQLAQEWKCAFIETSAKHNQNIQRVFELMLGEIEKASSDQKETQSCNML
ncbi:P-loop containing nucleoside triphosphate hydrolase protein [Gorgonomyces haynaldii]|nr:P-loop containing nucleoside triphosphate hydrolase protein [Gorgonomyces haynaldii]